MIALAKIDMGERVEKFMKHDVDKEINKIQMLRLQMQKKKEKILSALRLCARDHIHCF